jgi:hypothetical protein
LVKKINGEYFSDCGKHAASLDWWGALFLLNLGNTQGQKGNIKSCAIFATSQ